jgi:glycosyltransferase involved in cell wall biosynthesis
VGRLEPAKGCGDLIEALSLLRREFPQALAVIAGSGGLREQLEARAQARGVSDRVVFLGFQPDVNLVLDAIDVFVIPSLSETLGYALLEAMAHELPAVGTDVGGIPEVIVPGATGFLAAARSPLALATAARPLLASASLRECMGRAGRERVVTHFHEADMVRRTLAVYRNLLQVSRRG